MDMTESEARIMLAKNQNKIIKRIFNNIKDDYFDLNVNLSDIEAPYLSDFWVHAAGFLSLLNYENDNLPITSSDVEDILNGKFKLKVLSFSEAEKLMKLAKTPNSGGFLSSKPLYSIQDGTYYIESTRVKNSKGVPVSAKQIVLKTNELDYYTDSDDKIAALDDIKLLKMVRNAIAHQVPYIHGTELHYLNDDDEIVVSNMWLRGYSELFSLLAQPTDAIEFEKLFLRELPKQANYLENEKDIDSALSIVKPLFDTDVQTNFYRVNNFVKTRVQYTKDFYSKTPEEKTKILATICAFNPNYLKSANETINPAIIYNLQQLISQELDTRNVSVYMPEDDPLSKEVHDALAEYEMLKQRIDSFDAKNPRITSNFQFFQNQNIINELISIEKKLQALNNKLETRKKLESSKMELYEYSNIEHLPVEVAVNVVLLLAHNNLVNSAFYEDTLAKTDMMSFNAAQKRFFSGFDLNKLNVTAHSRMIENFSKEAQTAYILMAMRNALCHGNVTYVLPSVKRGDEPSFKDAVITFHANWQALEISGKVIDIYNIFSGEGFTKTRPAEVVTDKELYLRGSVNYSNDAYQVENKNDEFLDKIKKPTQFGE